MLPILLLSTHLPLAHESLFFCILAHAEYIPFFELLNIYLWYYFEMHFFGILVRADIFSLVYWLFIISMLRTACFCLLPIFLLLYNFSYCFVKASYIHVSIIYIANILPSSFLFMMLYSMPKFKLFRFDHIKLYYD